MKTTLLIEQDKVIINTIQLTTTKALKNILFGEKILNLKTNYKYKDGELVVVEQEQHHQYKYTYLIGE